jgi:hypothetical protein
MGLSAEAPINEAVALLFTINPALLDSLRQQFPQLAGELVPGRLGGAGDSGAQLNLDRARVMQKALEAAANRAEAELSKIRGRMQGSRKWRLRAQIVSLVGSSGVLGSLALDCPRCTILSALLALLASLGSLLADHQERLLKPGEGNIFDAYEKAGDAVYKAGMMAENLRLLIQHSAPSDDVRAAVESANALCEELNRWSRRMAGSS